MRAERAGMRKKTFDLLCNVGELTGLFQKSTNIKGLLHLTVKIISRHMQTEACSIFLLDKNNNKLVLRATVGLNPDMIGSLQLNIGEGITGTSLKESRPICVPRGSEDPNFKYVEGIFEEKYESFLAVPILRSSSQLGVIVLEDSQPDYYTQRDIRALSAIASQLATFLEHARMLLELRSNVKQILHQEDPSGKNFFRGQSPSSGIAMGQAVVISGDSEDNPYMQLGEEEYRTGEDDFEWALEMAATQLKEMQAHMEEKLSEAGSLIFGSHLLMLSDEEFSGMMRSRIKSGTPPAQAIVEVVNEYVSLFIDSKNANIQDKIYDVKDLGHRLLRLLSGAQQEEGDYSGQIVVARNLLPSELVKLAAQNTEGFVVYGSGETSHISILARSLEIPTVMLTDPEFFERVSRKILILDAFQGTVMIDPDEGVTDKYINLQNEMMKKAKQPAVAAPSIFCSSADAKNIQLLANINLLSDVKAARMAGTDGVGLYRSEYLFLVRNDFPPEEEQLLIYSKLIREMKDIYFRTLDIGGDKMLSAASIGAEDNPFMGLRAIRYSLKNPDVFKAQIRALLRAGTDTELKIMFPLISGLDDFEAARAIACEAMEELEKEGLAYQKKPKFGAMIELPSAVMLADELAAEADFLSIGSNDLTQYILGIDRTNEDVADLYSVYHPAVLRAFKNVALAALHHECPLSVCGDAVADRHMLLFFMGIGIRIFSVDPRMLGRVRAAISTIETSFASEHASKMLTLDSNGEVVDYVRELLQ